LPSTTIEALVYDRLKAALANSASVTVSFDGLNIATSSFVAAAFLPLLQQYSFDDLKRRLRVIGSTRQINQMIKLRLKREATAAA
jgi:hypothetical protein